LGLEVDVVQPQAIMICQTALLQETHGTCSWRGAVV